MNNVSSEVMNNSDLFRLILSYLRKEPKLKCKLCRKVCVWDKKVNNYIELSYYPWNMYGSIYCYECYKDLNISPVCSIC